MTIELVNSESIFGEQLNRRAAVHGALSDPHRLAIVDQLTYSDRSPSELAGALRIDSNLLAHHLGVLEGVKLIERVVSQGDRRRRYLRLVPSMLLNLDLVQRVGVERVVFICTENVARSQIAAALWNQLGRKVIATSGGAHPGKRIHPEAVRAARHRGLDLRQQKPGPVPDTNTADLVVTVCDRAHEQLGSAGGSDRIHWSVPDPVASEDPKAFETATDHLAERVEQLMAAFQGTAAGR